MWTYAAEITPVETKAAVYRGAVEDGSGKCWRT